MRDVLTAATLMGRSVARSLMVDACIVQRVVSVTPDDLTGADVPTYATVYTGACQVQSSEAVEQNPEAGSATLTVQRLTVKFPVGSFKPAVGLLVTMTSSTFDPHLAGRKYRVTALLHKTAATAYRLRVEEVA